MSALTLAAVIALATNPQCGAAAPGSEFANRLAAIAIHESEGDPLVVGVNADRERGLPAAVVRSATAQEAVTRARALLAQGRSLDLGLMQINTAQLARHGLTVETAFDACRSMAAGADHYAADVVAVWTLAHRRYNTGSTERGAAYAAGVEQVLARVRAQQSGAASPSAPVAASPPPPPSQPPCAPAWDAWALAECSARPAAPLPSPPADGASPASTPAQPVAPITTAAKDPAHAP